MRFLPSIVLKIFFGALAIRWAYALSLYFTMGDDGLQGVDSQTYVAYAAQFATTIKSGSVAGWQWLGPEPGIMPLFMWIITLDALAFPEFVPLTYVLTQCVLDAGTCVLVYLIATTINERYSLPAAAAAILNPTQIVMCGLAYNDTPFTFCAALFLFGAVRYLREPQWRHAVLIGGGLGAASLIRIVGAPWIVVMVLFLGGVLAIQRRLTFQHFNQLVAASVIAGTCVGVLLIRNVDVYGAWAITPQGGKHFAIWVVPLANEARDGTPWTTSRDKLEARKLERFGPMPANPFEDSRQYMEIGKEAGAREPLSAFAKSWLLGASLNLGSPAIILSPPVSQLPRTGFYATQGNNIFDKVWNFLLRSDNPAYAWILLLGIAGVAVVRCVQLVGVVAAVQNRSERVAIALFALWSCYMLAANGPVGSPKYRLPIEPVLMLAAGAGIYSLRERRKTQRGNSAG
jgi:hypothetical protein